MAAVPGIPAPFSLCYAETGAGQTANCIRFGSMELTMKDLTDPAQKATAAESPPSPKLNLRLQKSRRYTIPGFGTVRACLWRMHSADGPSSGSAAAYAVSLTGLGSRRLCLIGRQEREALALFDLLVRGRVTPTGLSDVLEELVEF